RPLRPGWQRPRRSRRHRPGRFRYAGNLRARSPRPRPLPRGGRDHAAGVEHHGAAAADPAEERVVRRALMLAALVAAVLAGPARAVTPDEQLKDPKLEARARAVSRELRCVVCQNQSIDDSEAPLAHDLRVILRERIAAGDTDAQAKAYL